ncbi:MAG TPA: hypothetical protein VHT70_05720 [Candidatus Saccharimonadales bacterium]|jgi:hypothetical protein|nr:hypothetical protein [Candidatus Saccharimonadales bacterium]
MLEFRYTNPNEIVPGEIPLARNEFEQLTNDMLQHCGADVQQYGSFRTEPIPPERGNFPDIDSLLW